MHQAPHGDRGPLENRRPAVFAIDLTIAWRCALVGRPAPIRFVALRGDSHGTLSVGSLPKFLVRGKAMLDRPSPGLVVVDGRPVGLIATLSLSGNEHAPSMAISIQRFKASTEATQCGNVAG